MSKPQLWMLVGGNGAGKSTFYQSFLQDSGLPFVNADVIAKEYFPEDPEGRSRDASGMAEKLRYRLLEEKRSFCFETVFSHTSKIDFLGDAKAAGYEITLVFIHLGNAELNKARVHQRVGEGGHNVPEDKIEARIERLFQHVRKVIELEIVDEIHVVDNSDYVNPFVRVALIRNGKVKILVDCLPDWLTALIKQ